MSSYLFLIVDLKNSFGLVVFDLKFSWHYFKREKRIGTCGIAGTNYHFSNGLLGEYLPEDNIVHWAFTNTNPQETITQKLTEAYIC